MDPKTEIELVGIKSTLDRILNHHDDFKDMFIKVFDKLDNYKTEMHDLDSKIDAGDNEVKNECKDGVREIYRNVALGGLGVITALVGGFFAWISNKL